MNEIPVDYKIIVADNIPDLQNDVRAQIILGWRPIGRLVICKNITEQNIFIRELVKYDIA